MNPDIPDTAIRGMLKIKPWPVLFGIALLSLITTYGIIYSELYVPTPGVWIDSQQEQNKSEKSSAHTNSKAGSSEKRPAFIKIIPPESTPDEARHRAYEEKEKPMLDRWLTYATIALSVFTFFLFCGTGFLAIYTYLLWRDASETSNRQSGEMKNSIAEAVRSANAMEAVAEATRDNAARMQSILHQQMRAYIAIDIGIPTCQDGEIRFAAAPVMTNTGFTPARKVSHKIMADILDANISDDYKFDESAQFTISDAVLSPRQQFVINSIVKNKLPIEDVPMIMQGIEKRLFVWGTITYEDIFGNPWETNFCHNFIFFREKNNEGIEIIKFFGYYYRSHNQAT